MKNALLFIAAACSGLFALRASAIDKEGLLSKYRDKFVVVTKEGLSTCLHGELDPGTLMILINDAGEAERTNVIGTGGGCGVEQVRKGEVLKVSHVSLSGRFLNIDLKTVSPHVATRGIGAFSHESIEMGSTELVIRASKGKASDTADALAALAAQWLTPFDSAADAAKFGNTATGVFVSQVKLGMTFAEVENALGVPQTRADLGEKVLYKYKDMTVEFHDGKVTDVR